MLLRLCEYRVDGIMILVTAKRAAWNERVESAQRRTTFMLFRDGLRKKLMLMITKDELEELLEHTGRSIDG